MALRLWWLRHFTFRRKSEYNGVRAQRIARKHLREIKVRNWEIDYEDPKTGDKWLMDYPYGYAHGGGPPRLRRVS